MSSIQFSRFSYLASVSGAIRHPAGSARRLQEGIQTDRFYTVVLYMGAALFAALVLLVPFYLLVRSAAAEQAVLETLTRSSTLGALGNTLLLAISVTIGSTMLAVPLAWLTTRTDLPGRKVWSVLHLLPLVIPSYIFAFLFVSFLSPKGLLQQLLQPLGVERLPPIYGFGGAFVVLTLISYPFVYLTVKAVLRQMDSSLLEVAQTYGAGKLQIARYVLLPYMWPAITAGGLLVALYSLRDFGAVTLLQFSTFTRVIFNRYQGFQLDEAAITALVLVLMTCIILLFETRLRRNKEDDPLQVGGNARDKYFELGVWRWPALLFSGTVSFLALFLPLGVLVYWIVRGARQAALLDTANLMQQNSMALRDVLAPAQSSLLIALLTAGLALLLALPIAIVSVRHQGRIPALLERLSYSSYALPGIVVALAFVFAGINFARPLYQTTPMLLAAYMVLFVPLAVSAERSALSRIPRELEEVASSLGGSRWQILRFVTLPLMRPGLFAGGALVFLTVMKELPATLLLSPLGFRTLPMLIWTNINEAFFVRAAVPTLLLLLLSSLPLAWLSIRDNN